jgi:hypothetical protein
MRKVLGAAFLELANSGTADDVGSGVADNVGSPAPSAMMVARLVHERTLTPE